VFWEIMTAVSLLFCVVYGALSVWGERFGISAYTRRRMRNGSWLLLAWAAVSIANLVR